MKKALLLLGLAVGSLFFVAQTTKAENLVISFPDNAIGIDEATYQQLKNAQYTDIEHYDQILYEYQDTIVFRAQHLGEMYKVPMIGEKPHTITRYLPDGFYKVNNKYYWLTNGAKALLKKARNMTQFIIKQQTN